MPNVKLSFWHPLNVIQLLFVVASVEVLNWGATAITVNRSLIVICLSVISTLVAWCTQTYVLKRRIYTNRFFMVNAFLFPAILIGVTYLMMILLPF